MTLRERLIALADRRLAAVEDAGGEVQLRDIAIDAARMALDEAENALNKRNSERGARGAMRSHYIRRETGYCAQSIDALRDSLGKP